ncbi:class I SAM-dependent methyltransferase [Crocosphaera sp.]|uniref:class I SAM-dependent methyltransferase n=1 Tax=Crocosphaera sp. TaxID=2729996 RepID=UPI003F1FFE12|nr:class I SAM-dependent methyltransferase [Crocosphaera sp.]
MTKKIDSEREKYSGAYGNVTLHSFSQRTASKEADFFLPYLSSNMALLDCGCGPGTITVDLAKMVAPASVIGIDIEDCQFEIGRKKAQQENVINVNFQVGNIYELPFPDHSLDAVFAHAVIYHLKHPEQALQEVYRVLKSGGIVGIRDADHDHIIFTPSSPIIEKAWDLLGQVVTLNGGDPFFGKYQRKYLQKAGFVDVKASASFDYAGTRETIKQNGEFWADLILQKQVTQVILNHNLATQQELETMSQTFIEWGNHPDAFFARARCEAVAWKP